MVRVASLLVLALLAGAACGRSDAESGGSDPFEGVAVEQPVAKPDFVLTDTEGQPYDFAAETDGRVALLYFGYTYCPDICPIHLANLAEVLPRPGQPRNVEVVFVTVDPDRDTPERIRQFLDSFDVDFVGLTGSEEQLAAAQEAAGLPPATRVDGSDDEYLMSHAAQVLAYAPDGLGYTEYPSGTRLSTWAHDLPALAEMRPADGT